MIRSTTPVLIFKVDEHFDMSTIRICHITLQSMDESHTQLYTAPVIDAENHRIRQTMSQSETKAFEVGTIKIQLKVKLTSDAVIASKVILTTMSEILEEGEL